MSNTDIKLYTINSVAMLLSFSNLENTLKIMLLIASIFYTIVKTIETLRNKKNDNKGSDS